MSRGRSTSPRPLDIDEDMNNDTAPENPNAKVVIVTNLTKSVFETHLQTIFGFYGEIVKVDLPLYATSGQNRGKAALEYADAAAAHKAAAHMNGGQLDGAIVNVEVSDLPIQTTRPRSRPRQPPRNGRLRSHSLSLTPPPPRRRGGGGGGGGYDARDSYRGPRPPYGTGRRGPPERDTYRPPSRSRSRSPFRRGGRLPPRRRSPSYARGGTGATGGRRPRTRSRSFSVTSSRSRSRSSRTRSRTRSRSRSFVSYSSRSRSHSRGRRSLSRDDIRDSRSRSRTPPPPQNDM